MKVDKGPEERGEDWIAVANGSMVANQMAAAAAFAERAFKTRNFAPYATNAFSIPRGFARFAILERAWFDRIFLHP